MEETNQVRTGYPEAYPVTETVVVHEGSDEVEEVMVPEVETQLQVVEPTPEPQVPHFLSHPGYFHCRKCNLTVEYKTLEQRKTIYYFHKRYGCQLAQLNPGKEPKVMGRQDLIGAWEEQVERRQKNKKV